MVGGRPLLHTAILYLLVAIVHQTGECIPGRRLYSPGFASAARDASKRRAYWQGSFALPFVPMPVKSFRRLGAPALTLVGDLADQAVQVGGHGLFRAAFIAGALRELSVALCRGNASLCRSSACVATRASVRAP
jgi:hypothetical protein